MPGLIRQCAALGVGAALLAAQAATAATAPPPALRDRVWPQSYSDLPADPQVRFGVLPNGLRYAVMHNATPTGQVSLRLRIGSGSLEEDASEQGLAHVLEHMAFKGSVHAPNGEMVKLLQRKGLSFGGDTNAHTGFTDTVYQLDLPESDAATVDLGLTLLRDVGDGLLIDLKALQSERGVVLSEERLRDTPDYEVNKTRIGFELKGQLAADRLPIGKVGVIESAPASLVRRFYEANYRPDNATLIAVGDFDPAVMESDLRKAFGGWKPSAAPTHAPDLGRPEPRRAGFQLVVRKGAAPSLTITWAAPHDDTPDGFARERRDFVESLALAALNRRLQRTAHAPDAPFLGAGVSREDAERSARLTTLQVLFRDGGWRRALDAAVGAERQALRYGFSQAEVDREITEVGVTLKTAAAGAATRRSPALAEELVRTADEQQVDTSPAEDLKLYAAFTQDLTAAEVDAALRKAFQGSGPLVSLAAPDPVDGGDGALAGAFRTAEAVPLAPPASLQAFRWTHSDFGAPGRVVETRTVSDLGVTFVRFANGVRLAVKPTGFGKDDVQVAVNFGLGRLGKPSDRIDTGWAQSAFVSGGLRDLSYEDVQQVLADRAVSISLGTGDDAYTLAGGTRPQDLDVQLQLLAAYMTQPGWRPEAFAHVKALLGVALAQFDATPQGVESRDLPPLLHDGDKRWALPDAAELQSASLDQLKALLQPALERGPLEVTVVGDTTVEAAIRAVAATFGALPPRPGAEPAQQATSVRLPPGGGAPVERLHHGRPDQAVAYIAWPATDLLSDPQRARRINMAAEVLQLRLIDKVRIAEGASYSPTARAYESEDFPGYGYVSAAVETPPAKVAGFYATAAAIAQDLRAHDVGADELKRAVEPRIEGIEKAQQTNGYWSAMLHDADRDPRRLELIRGSVAGYRALTASDLRQAANAYLDDARAFRFQVEPPNPAPAAPGAAALPVPPVASRPVLTPAVPRSTANPLQPIAAPKS